MNDLILREAVTALPSMAEGLLRAYKLLQQVNSFEDVERLFLLGAGLSAHTYRAYLQSIKDFYAFTEGLHPLQVLPADIERWFDSLRTREMDPKTVNLRISGLRKFFSGIRNVIPSYTSPFEIMGEKLTSKLRMKTHDKTKKALNKEEIRKLLKWLRSECELRDYAIIFFLLTSGLRAAEALSLRWENLELSEGIWTATFIAKGGRLTTHEIYQPAVEVVRAHCQHILGRDPLPTDNCFWLPSNGDIARPLVYHTLWHRMKQLGKKAQSMGLIRRSLEFSPHLFRRSYITGLYRAGMKLKALQQKSRHRNMTVLIDHYIDDSEPASPYLAQILEEIAVEASR